MDLHQTCVAAVGKIVKYTGTNGNEYDKANHGLFVKGEGLCAEQHDSHGLCIVVYHEDGTRICVDPITVEIVADSEEEAWAKVTQKAWADWAGENLP